MYTDMRLDKVLLTWWGIPRPPDVVARCALHFRHAALILLDFSSVASRWYAISTGSWRSDRMLPTRWGVRAGGALRHEDATSKGRLGDRPHARSAPRLFIYRETRQMAKKHFTTYLLNTAPGRSLNDCGRSFPPAPVRLYCLYRQTLEDFEVCQYKQ